MLIESTPTLDFPLPSFVPHRYRPGNLGTWSGHLAFANDLIAAIQPALIVELGTHWGESYFTFCQSVVENRLSCVCYAVDTWSGDAHAGTYGEEVFSDVQEHNNTHYRSFSYLLRATFDDALRQFTDESIDLLHVDGFHTYEAVTHDFRTWLPKVRPGGIILFHDITARHADFGVWRLWEELQAEFPDTFTFNHWWGLGVLRKPGHGLQRRPLLGALFDSPPLIKERIRRYYVLYASHLETVLYPREQQPRESTKTRIQLFPFGDSGHSESTSLVQCIELDKWQQVTFDLPNGLGNGPLRLDLADCPSIIELGKIIISGQRSGDVFWATDDPVVLRSLDVCGTSILLPYESGCVFLSFGRDPQLLLHKLEGCNHPTTIEISVRISTAADAIEALFRKVITDWNATITNLHSELTESKNEQGRKAAELSRISAELKREISEKETIRSQLTRYEADVISLKQAVASAQEALSWERQLREAMLRSWSWRFSRPVRDLMGAFRGRTRRL